VRAARAKILDGSPEKPKLHVTRPEDHTASTSMDDDGGGSDSLWQIPSSSTDEELLFRDIPVGIREFMATEKRIRDRRKSRKEKGLERE